MYAIRQYTDTQMPYKVVFSLLLSEFPKFVTKDQTYTFRIHKTRPSAVSRNNKRTIPYDRTCQTKCIKAYVYG